MPARSVIAGMAGVPSRSVLGEGHVGAARLDQPLVLNSPTACQEGMSSESPEPLAGRLGAPAQRKHRV
jgi:hypothetical protein